MRIIECVYVVPFKIDYMVSLKQCDDELRKILYNNKNIKSLDFGIAKHNGKDVISCQVLAKDYIYRKCDDSLRLIRVCIGKHFDIRPTRIVYNRKEIKK